MESQNPKAWGHSQQLKHTAEQERIKMEEDFNNTLDDIDNFLNDIWSNADLNPPDPDGKRIDIQMGTGEHQLNSQTVRNMNRENFAVKEETVAEGSNLCTRVTIQSANQSARGPSGENIVVKEETDTEECNLHVVVSNQNADQSATGTSCKNFVTKQEIVAGGNNNTQSATGGPSRSMVDRAGIRWRRMLKNRASAARSRARSLVLKAHPCAMQQVLIVFLVNYMMFQ